MLSNKCLYSKQLHSLAIPSFSVRCVKKYCVCFANGNKCDTECRCLDCKNGLITNESDADLPAALEMDSGMKEMMMKDAGQLTTPCLTSFAPQDMAPAIVTGPTQFANI